MFIVELTKFKNKINNTLDEKEVEVDVLSYQLEYNNDICTFINVKFNYIVCPTCKNIVYNTTILESFFKCGSVSRSFTLTGKNKSQLLINVTFLRVRCKTCRHTHILLPDTLIPYTRITLREAFNLLCFNYCLIENSVNIAPDIEGEFLSGLLSEFEYAYSLCDKQYNTFQELLTVISKDIFLFNYNYYVQNKCLFLNGSSSNSMQKRRKLNVFFIRLDNKCE